MNNANFSVAHDKFFFSDFSADLSSFPAYSQIQY